MDWLLRMILLAACAVTWSRGQSTTITEHVIDWTREGVQQYQVPTGSPLRVRLGDKVHFNCSSNISEFQRITRLDDIRQYDSCNCSAIPGSCARIQLLAIFCLAPPLPPVTITITSASGQLNSVLEYVPGETYYMTSLDGVVVETSSGGACEPSANGPALKMAMTVLSSDPALEDTPTTTTRPARSTIIPSITLALSSGHIIVPSYMIHILTLMITTLITVILSSKDTTTAVSGRETSSTQPSSSQGLGSTGNGGDTGGGEVTVLPAMGLNRTTDSNINAAVIGGTEVLQSSYWLVVLVCVTVITLVHRKEMSTVASESGKGERPGYVYEVNIEVQQHVTAPTIQSTPTQEGYVLKPQDSDFKRDLSLSQSFQRYEVMNAVLRNSQSSLLAVIEKSDTGESGEGEADEEEREAGCDGEVEGKGDEGRSTGDAAGEADKTLPTHAETRFTVGETEKTSPTHPETHPSPMMLKLVSIDDSSTNLIVLDSPKHAPNFVGASPHREPLSSQVSFTGLALERCQDKNWPSPDTQDAPLGVKQAGQDTPIPLFPMSEEAPGSKETPPKPAPAPRKVRSGPSTSSTDDIMLDTTTAGGEECSQESRPGDGEYPNTRPLKPKPKTRSGPSTSSTLSETAAAIALGSGKDGPQETRPDREYPSTTYPRPLKPKPKLRSGPSSQDLTAAATAASEDADEGSEEKGDGYSSTTYPRPSKPKPKPRGTKKSESGGKGGEVNCEVSTPYQDTAVSENS